MRKTVVLAIFGGLCYGCLELLWRGNTHWTMVVMGGALFLVLGGLNEWLPWDMPLALQAVIGALVVTAAEFLAGMVLNIWLGMGIWDYSGLWGNVMGQICPEYSALWVLLSAVAIILDDWMRFFLWGEERPHYKII